MLYRRGDVYWVQFKHQGRRVRISTGVRVSAGQRALAQARVEARRLRVEHEQAVGPGGRAQGVTLAVLEQLDVDRARAKGLGDRREATLDNLWRNLERHLGEHRDISTLTAGELDDYEGKRRGETHRGRPTSGQTIRRERDALVRGLKLAKRRGLIDRLPFDLDDLDVIRSDLRDMRAAGKVWTARQIDSVIDALSPKAKAAAYDRMLRLIQRTGMRLQEFRRCATFERRPAPRGYGAKQLLVIDERSKTRRSRLVPLLAADVATIDELGATFQARKFNHALMLASAAAGLPGVLTPRDLRAWYLTTAAATDPLAAQRLGGHANIATTGLYLQADLERSLRAGTAAAKLAGGHNGGPQRKRRRQKAL